MTAIQDTAQQMIDSLIKSDEAPRVAVTINNKALKNGTSFLGYLTKTSLELSKVFDQMLIAEFSNRSDRDNCT